MARPSDWWVLDLDRDPTPGAPDRIDITADRFLDFAETAERAYRAVTSLQGDGAVLTWVGLSGDAFREQFGEFPEQLRKLYTSHQIVGDALVAFSPKLTTAQAQADRALADGREARDRLATASAQLNIVQGDFDAISRQADELRNGQSESNQPDKEQVAQALRDADAAKQRLSTAQGAVASAEQALQAAKTLAEQARQMRETASGECAREIRHASDVGIQPRSFWQKLGDAFKKLWDIICEVAKWVALVAGVIALVIGGPLAWVALAAGAVLLVKAIIDFSQGKGKVLDLIFGIIGIIPGVRGLTSLSKLQSLYKAGGMKAIGQAALAGMKNFVLGVVNVIKTAGVGAVNVVKNIGANIGSKAGDLGSVGRGRPQAPVNVIPYQDDITGVIDSTHFISNPIVAFKPAVGRRPREPVTIGVSFPSKHPNPASGDVGDIAYHAQWGEQIKYSGVNNYFNDASTRAIPAPWRTRGKDPIFVMAHSSPNAAGGAFADAGSAFNSVAFSGGDFAKILDDSAAFQALRSMPGGAERPIVLVACKFLDDMPNNTVAPDFINTLRNITRPDGSHPYADAKVFAPNSTVYLDTGGTLRVSGKDGAFEELK